MNYQAEYPVERCRHYLKWLHFDATYSDEVNGDPEHKNPLPAAIADQI